MGRLEQKLENYIEGDSYAFHMPGHKRNVKVLGDAIPDYMKEWYRRDITEIDDFDDMHHPEGVLKDAMQEVAEFYGAKESFYLVNGCSSGVLIALSAVAPKRSKILMMRSSHKSAYHAVFLRELLPVYLYGSKEEALGMDLGISLFEVKEALKKHPDVRAAFFTCPTYEGIGLPLKEITQYLQERGIPVIVDAAHGAHFGMADFLPENAVSCGADLVVHSLHKTLPSPTMSALLHLNSQRIHRETVWKFYNIYQTSSPSYPMMAGMECLIDYLKNNSPGIWENFYQLRKEFSEGLKNLTHLGLLDAFAGENGRRDVMPEPGKLVVYPKSNAVSGQKLMEILQKEYHLQPEMAMPGYVLFILTVCDTREGYQRLQKALLEIDRREELWTLEEAKPAWENVSFPAYEKEKAMEIHEAYDAETEWVPVTASKGRIAGKFVFVYPPGQPFLVPGELIGEKEVVEVIGLKESGCNLVGIKTEKVCQKADEIQICVLK